MGVVRQQRVFATGAGALLDLSVAFEAVQVNLAAVVRDYRVASVAGEPVEAGVVVAHRSYFFGSGWEWELVEPDVVSVAVAENTARRPTCMRPEHGLFVALLAIPHTRQRGTLSPQHSGFESPNGRLHWCPWGSSLASQPQCQQAAPGNHSTPPQFGQACSGIRTLPQCSVAPSPRSHRPSAHRRGE